MKIPADLRETIKLLAKQKTHLGYTEDAVAENILRFGYNKMVECEYVKKLFETRDLLRHGSRMLTLWGKK